MISPGNWFYLLPVFFTIMYGTAAFLIKPSLLDELGIVFIGVVLFTIVISYLFKRFSKK